MFDSANTAEERRGFRTARRRLDRRSWRIELLQELFDTEIRTVDPGFFLRMKESKLDTDETQDVRLVYLALHHMMKHRGHFLFSGNIENIKEFQETFRQYVKSIRDEELDFDFCIEDEELQGIENILKDSNLTRSAKKTRLIKLSGAHTACEKAILNLVASGSVKVISLGTVSWITVKGQSFLLRMPVMMSTPV